MLPLFQTAADIDADGHIAYVDTLAANAFSLVTEKCTTDGIDCDGFDPAGTSDIDAQTSAAVAAVPADPCAGGGEAETYNQGLHIGGIFIILGASLLGAGLPVLGKYVPLFAVHPYILVLGKCLGIGIILACALVHMLQPSAEELGSPCLSAAFTQDYGAYPYLFCMLAILMMQFIDYAVEDFIVSKMAAQANANAVGQEGKKMDETATNNLSLVNQNSRPTDSVTIVPTRTSPRASDQEAAIDMSSGSYQNAVHLGPVAIHHGKAEDCQPSALNVIVTVASGDAVDLDDDSNQHMHMHKGKELVPGSPHGHSHGGEHGHVHSVLFLKGVKRTIAAYLLEFSVTAHSVFIGVTTGIVSQQAFHALIVALVFHQCFEGVALGSRIAEAELGSRTEEVAMVMIFALSAPLGMAIGVGVTSTINPDGATYNYASGIFDSVCAGILLYIGLMLLLKDFPEDVQKHCAGNKWKKLGMFVALWTGAGVMAYIGKYL